VDVVYICRSGPNEELRYSLRSLVNIEHDRVFVFGGAPAWYTGNLIGVPQTGTKQQNAKQNLLTACLHSRVSDPFLLMNDDFYIVKPTVPTLYDRGPITGVIAEYERTAPGGGYLESMRETYNLLMADGYADPLSYELHVPMPVLKRTMYDTLMTIFAHGMMSLQNRTIYGALAGLPSITIPDPKVYEVGDSIPDGPYLSSLDQRFDLVRPLLEELFPEPCQYEAADTATVIRQEDGPMYVSPSRVIRHGVLIAYAGESMTEAEAHRRGLDTTEEPAAPEPTPEPDYDAMNVRELKALLDERGVAYPKRANRSMLLTLVE